jgi:hypothetical protein
MSTYEHDRCPGCRFLYTKTIRGHVVDYWVCGDAEDVTFIARYGNNGGDYVTDNSPAEVDALLGVISPWDALREMYEQRIRDRHESRTCEQDCPLCAAQVDRALELEAEMNDGPRVSAGWLNNWEAQQA